MTIFDELPDDERLIDELVAKNGLPDKHTGYRAFDFSNTPIGHDQEFVPDPEAF